MIKSLDKKINLEKKFLIAEGILVLGALIYLFFSIAPNQQSPIAGKTILDPDFVFEIADNEELLISLDESFANPMVLKKGDEIDLPPGTYYWKVRNWFRESEIQSFTIEEQGGFNIVIEKPEIPVEKKPGITTKIEGESK